MNSPEVGNQWKLVEVSGKSHATMDSNIKGVMPIESASALDYLLLFTYCNLLYRY